MKKWKEPEIGSYEVKMFIIPNILSRTPKPPPDVTMETGFKCEYSGKTRQKEEKTQCNCSKGLANVAENLAQDKISF